MSYLRKTGSLNRITLFALDGGIDLKKIILAVLVLVALMGMSAAVNPVWIERNVSFSFEQSVQGNGYFMNYMYVKAGNLAMKNYAHGSGSINNEAILNSFDYNRTDHPVAEDYIDRDIACIQFKEDNAIVYAPMRMAIGNGYYAANPVDYSSLIKEKTWVKNYRAGSSMHHEVEYAHALDKELDLVVKDNATNIYDPKYYHVAVTQMKINEDVTDGKAHIGVLQEGNDPGYYTTYIGADLTDPRYGTAGTKGPMAWKKPAIEIDEDYWGTYHIEKNMTLEVPYSRIEKNDDWLPCCFGGYLTMPTYYQWGSKGFGSNVKGIFDCTCYTVPTVAQFARVY